ncbi:MAG: nucleotidyltransferase domain-containing protein [Acidobacteria bacterium]|nr:nucleotidyltransferase domain-containing protein [Acidobacteriota bacterium]
MRLPDGTQVVVRGTRRVGAVARESAGIYTARYADGAESHHTRSELTILKHESADWLGTVDAAALRPYIQYDCVVGSRAYGLETDASDTDRREFFLPPADLHWPLPALPEQIEDDAEQECYLDLEKFLRLALKANPNVLEVLYSPLVVRSTPLADELIAMRDVFLSRAVHQTYNGYVLSQFKKTEQDLRQHGVVRWKHAMHLIRLLLSGITALREGFVPLAVGSHRERLLAIKAGALAWEEVEAWRLQLHAEFDAAVAERALPEQPNWRRANDFLLRARRRASEPGFKLES